MGAREIRNGDGAVRAYLGLGASLGDRLQNLRDALHRLQDAGIKVVAVSPVYESPHLGVNAEDARRYPPHLNVVAAVDTTLDAYSLLDAVQAAEDAGGRLRVERWGPRTIDIDILAYGARAVNTRRLTVPHPGLADRAFVARPLLDLEPNFRLSDGSALGIRLQTEPLKSQPIVRLRTFPWP